jgi:dynein heavy chain
MPDVGNLEWVSINVKDTADKPTKRSGHSVTMCGLPNSPQLVVIGGFTENGHVNEVWQLKLGAETFEWVKTKIGQEKYGPSPRWRHTATLMPGGKSIFVFGGMCKKQRFNDGFLLSTERFRWSKPSPEISGSVPAPRANHSATLVGDTIFFFGGYGGTGYARSMFNDLHSMDTKSFEFTKLTTSGTIPDPRSNHVAVHVGAAQDQLFVLGGRSFTGVYDDLHVLDLESLKWDVDKSVTTPEPVYNHAGIACMAVPTWKAFFFGGKSGTYDQQEDSRKYSSSIAVLEVRPDDAPVPREWMTQVVIGGTPPSAREDTNLAYDSKNSRMVLFGGWSDDLNSDVHALDVSMIVGPPYAVTGIEPAIGPVDGGAEVIIQGMGFEDTPMINVRFSFGAKGDQYADGSNAQWISPTELKVTTPNFEEHGPKKVDVRISMKGDAMSTTRTAYTFYENTKAGNCIVFGPGAAGEICPGVEASIVIQAVDGAGQKRTSGGDVFQVKPLPPSFSRHRWPGA